MDNNQTSTIDNQKLIIAIDGFSACGKSTFAKAIARKLGYAYIDTGAMYRAVTLYALQNGMINGDLIDIPALTSALDDIHITFQWNPGTQKNETFLNDVSVENEIRQAAISGKVSEISAVKEVRKKLIFLQQEMGRDKAVVMDGRDTGTGVFPNADIKIFMTAGVEIRTRRRCDELKQKGLPACWEQVKQNLLKRDHLDRTRAENPLRRAPDAVVLDNSQMTLEEQMVWFEEVLKETANARNS
jgi:cytidylate kinase